MNQQIDTQTPQADFMSEIRSRFVIVMIGLGISMSLVMLAMTVAGMGDEIGFPLPVSIVLLIGSIGSAYFAWRGGYTLILIDAMLLATIAAAFIAPIEQTFLALSATTILLAALLGSRYAYLATTFIFIVRLGYLVQPGQGKENVFTEQPFSTFSVLLIVLLVSALVFYVSYSIQKVAGRAHRSTDLLQAASTVGQGTSQLLELQELLNRAVNMIRDNFGYYHVQIFLVDEAREFANLVASTGQVGQLLIDRGHKLGVGTQSVIGRVTQLGESVIALDTDADSIHARNELLPNTRSELALPIVDGARIIGALDVQSVRENAFDDADLQALQVLSNQLAVAIRNARLFADQATNVRENKRLFLESEANLREIQRLNRELTGQAWEHYLTGKQSVLGVALDESGDVIEAHWTPRMVEAGQKRRPVVASGERPAIAVPIVLRGEVIGAIEVEPGAETRIDDTSEMMRAIAGHLALSLDNARLFEEAQEMTLQEQRINAIVDRYQAAGTVDDLLQITLNELGQTFGAQRAMIRLGRAKSPTTGDLDASDPLAQQNGGRQS